MASKTNSEICVFLGSFVHSLSRNEPLVITTGGLIGVKNGKILFVDVEDNLESLKQKYCFTSDDIYIIGQGEFLMPGMIDTHIHASQYPNAGLGLDLELLQWLETYTFPMESKFKDPSFARNCYRKVVQRTLENGTTTATYFGTIHRQASEILGEVVEQFGQRAFIGKVCMDCYSPDFYIETTEESLKSTEEFVVNILKRKCDRVQPIVTPRFALTCSKELLVGLGEIARKHDVHIQTHLCESLPEIRRALELFPGCKTYTDVYKSTGLLGPKTVMAHCVHMKPEEIEIMKETSTGIAHCPTSNLDLLSGLCPVRKMLDSGVRIGLGTDVSGGYTPSILEAMRHAILTSKALKINGDEGLPLSHRDVFYLATLGGAEALGLDSSIGNFQVGKSFDALHVDLASSGSTIHQFPGETLGQMIEKFVMLADDRNICEVFVEGRKVKSTIV